MDRKLFGRQSQLRELVAECLLDSVTMASTNICLNNFKYMCKVLPIVTPTIYLCIYPCIPSSITMWGLSKIPFTFWSDRTPYASPLRALARVGVFATFNKYPPNSMVTW